MSTLLPPVWTGSCQAGGSSAFTLWKRSLRDSLRDGHPPGTHLSRAHASNEFVQHRRPQITVPFFFSSTFHASARPRECFLMLVGLSTFAYSIATIVIRVFADACFHFNPEDAVDVDCRCASKFRAGGSCRKFGTQAGPSVHHQGGAGRGGSNASESEDDAFEEDEEFALPPEIAPTKQTKEEES
eukprot:1189722-Prorocentrum_minimum.AAC.4